MNNYEAIVKSLAKAGFKLHYEATKQPHWTSADEHWMRNPQARELWEAIVVAVLVGAESAGAGAIPQNAAKTLIERFGRKGGPMTPLLERKPARGPAQPLPLPETPPKLVPGDPGPFPDDPRPDFKEDPKGYAKWKTRNIYRIYGGPHFGKGDKNFKEIVAFPYGDAEARVLADIPPGLAIERLTYEPGGTDPGPDPAAGDRPTLTADEIAEHERRVLEDDFGPEEREAERSKLARDE